MSIPLLTAELPDPVADDLLLPPRQVVQILGHIGFVGLHDVVALQVFPEAHRGKRWALVTLRHYTLS